MENETSGWVVITSVENGYTIEIHRWIGGKSVSLDRYVARSWAEVLELLEEVEAPDMSEVVD